MSNQLNRIIAAAVSGLEANERGSSLLFFFDSSSYYHVLGSHLNTFNSNFMVI